MNRLKFLAAVSAVGLLGLCPGVSGAQDRGTKAEAKSMVEAAVAHAQKVGTEQAFKDFQNDKATWFKKDLYVFAYDMKGVCMALGANDRMVGKDLIEMRDPNGKPIIKEFIATVSANKMGWVDYDFANPTTKKIGSKVSYVQKLPNYDGFVGVGVYVD